MGTQDHTAFDRVSLKPWTVGNHPFYADTQAALVSGDKADLAAALVKAKAIQTDCRAHDFPVTDANDAHWQGEHAYMLVQSIERAIASPTLDTETELRLDAEFRSGRDDQGGFHGESLSWANIGRDGRHGRGHEL